MSDLNGSTTKERPTSDGAILTVTRPHGTYEIVRTGSRIVSAGYREAGAKARKFKKAIQEHNKETEKKTEQKKKSMWSKAGSFLAAVKSKAFEGAVSLAVLDHRHQCCHGTTLAGMRVNTPCTARFEHEGHAYCKSCGCGEWKLARLDAPADNPTESKLAFPDLTCPLNRFGPMPGARKESNAPN